MQLFNQAPTNANGVDEELNTVAYVKATNYPCTKPILA